MNELHWTEYLENPDGYDPDAIYEEEWKTRARLFQKELDAKQKLERDDDA